MGVGKAVAPRMSPANADLSAVRGVSKSELRRWKQPPHSAWLQKVMETHQFPVNYVNFLFLSVIPNPSMMPIFAAGCYVINSKNQYYEKITDVCRSVDDLIRFSSLQQRG